ncbi:hypothetical protein SteCoe_29186 [Stentor coeruleus]|uniref:Uncharacterized protein n=1 Tax=Stentor coeruleus TaxID=5963 RepID=A0A1R2B6G6_9CILI|nr:hypothetical protein SteCoe_29186 [Stentor coeruleus]
MDSPSLSGKWKLVSNVISATNYFMTPNSEVISDIDSMIEALKRHPSLIRQETTATRMTEIEYYKYTAALFDFIRRSSTDDLERIEKLITNNPKRYIIDNSSTESLLNKQFNGIRPLYESCKYGFLDTAKLLIKYGSDPYLLSDNGEDVETCLEVAVRWNHISIVQYLMETLNWQYKTLKKCLKATNSPKIKEMITPKIVKRKGFCFCG